MKREFGIFLVFTSPLWANIADWNFSYQDYLDFGSNKGRFTAGSKNLYLISKKGERLEFDPEIYMPNFVGSTNSLWGGLGGTNTYVGGSYFYTANHNAVFPKVDSEDPNSATKPYYLGAGLIIYTSASSDPTACKESTGMFNGDVAFVRMNKFVTALIPHTDNVEIDGPIDSKRYTQAWRSGMGNATYRNPNGSLSPLGGTYAIRTGGRLNVADTGIVDTKIQFRYSKNLQFSDVVTSGDSGSPIFLWDSVDKVWRLAGAVSTGEGQYVSNYAPY